MAYGSPIFVGVDIIRSAGRNPRAYVYAAFDEDQALLALGHGDKNEILAYLGGQAAAYIAISAPQQPKSNALKEQTQGQYGLLDMIPKHKERMRTCEHTLQTLGFPIVPTLATLKTCPGWMQKGFFLYQQLQALGFQVFPRAESNRQLLETHSEAVFWRLLNAKLPLPNSLEGRLQRQLVLYSQGLPVADAMDFFVEITRYKLLQGALPDKNIHSYEELNALAAAFISWLAYHQPKALDLIGDVKEGQIVLPVKAHRTQPVHRHQQ